MPQCNQTIFSRAASVSHVWQTAVKLYDKNINVYTLILYAGSYNAYFSTE